MPRFVLGKHDDIVGIFGHPLLGISQTFLVLADGHGGLVHIVLLPHRLGADIVHGLVYHGAQSSLEDGGKAELPLHQSAYKHNQIVRETLVEEQVGLHLVLRAAMFLHRGINFLEEILADTIILHQHLARGGLFRQAETTALGGNLEQTFEVGHIRNETDVGDAQVDRYHRLEIHARQGNEILHTFGRNLLFVFVEQSGYYTHINTKLLIN